MRAVEDLLAAVRDAQSRVHLAEAVAAYQAGAFRAAIISTWVAVALDLVAKMRELAELGEKSAKADAATLDKAIASGDTKALRNFEAGLLDKCLNDYAFINSREHTELTRLRDDRHVCAHPAFVSVDEVFTPTPELVRIHLSAAVDAVLSQGPTPGRGAIDRFTTETQAVAWPGNQDDLVAYLRARYLDRAKDTVRRAIAHVTVKGVLTAPDGNELASSRLAATAHALEVISPPLLDDALRTVLTRIEEGGGLSDEQLLRFAGKLGDLESAWEALPETSKPKLIELLKNVPGDDLVRHGVTSIDLTDSEAAAILSSRVDALVELPGGVEVLGQVIERGRPAHLRRRAIGLLKDSPSWRSAETRMRLLVLPYADLLTLDELLGVFDAIRDNAQVRESSAMPPMVEALFERTVNIPGALAAWDNLSDWLTRQGREGRPDDWYAYPQLRAKVVRVSESRGSHTP